MNEEWIDEIEEKVNFYLNNLIFFIKEPYKKT